jgi:hypothetical protein
MHLKPLAVSYYSQQEMRVLLVCDAPATGQLMITELAQLQRLIRIVEVTLLQVSHLEDLQTVPLMGVPQLNQTFLAQAWIHIQVCQVATLR